MASHWKRARKPVTHRRDDKLARLNPSAFEALIAEHYRGQGYQVERVGHGGAHFDGGIDLKLRRGDEYIVVQCKRENAYKVTHNVGHELIGVMCTQGATGAIVVNAGEFTEHARESAQGERRLTLVDGDEVRRWFPELASPASEPQWERVSAGGRSPRPRSSRRRGDEGVKAAFAFAGLIGLLMWQCSRPDPEVRRARPQHTAAQAAPIVAAPPARPRVEAAQQPAHRITTPSGQTMEEWERRNRESMEILRETTPEIDLAP